MPKKNVELDFNLYFMYSIILKILGRRNIMKRFIIYSLIVLTLVASFTAFKLMSPTIPEAEASIMCMAGCLVLAATYCEGCNESQIAAVAMECYNNHCQ
jgi:hypothetical protein